jgi:hypothetical protein
MFMRPRMTLTLCTELLELSGLQAWHMLARDCKESSYYQGWRATTKLGLSIGLLTDCEAQCMHETLTIAYPLMYTEMERRYTCRTFVERRCSKSLPMGTVLIMPQPKYLPTCSSQYRTVKGGQGERPRELRECIQGQDRGDSVGTAQL